MKFERKASAPGGALLRPREGAPCSRCRPDRSCRPLWPPALAGGWPSCAAGSGRPWPLRARTTTARARSRARRGAGLRSAGIVRCGETWSWWSRSSKAVLAPKLSRRTSSSRLTVRITAERCYKSILQLYSSTSVHQRGEARRPRSLDLGLVVASLPLSSHSLPARTSCRTVIYVPVQ